MVAITTAITTARVIAPIRYRPYYCDRYAAPVYGFSYGYAPRSYYGGYYGYRFRDRDRDWDRDRDRGRRR
jgi:hypothetical protein